MKAIYLLAIAVLCMYAGNTSITVTYTPPTTTDTLPANPIARAKRMVNEMHIADSLNRLLRQRDSLNAMWRRPRPQVEPPVIPRKQ
jgi:hypothetical protein